MSAEVAYTVDFGRPPKVGATPGRPGRVLRVARLLALAHQIDARIRAGEYDDLADAARKLGLTRARVTQIANLTLLAPEIQEAILNWPPIAVGRDPVTERTLRQVVAEPSWETQGKVWRRSLTSSQVGPNRAPSDIARRSTSGNPEGRDTGDDPA